MLDVDFKRCPIGRETEKGLIRMEGKIDVMSEHIKALTKTMEEHICSQSKKDDSQDKEIEKNKINYVNALKYIATTSITIVIALIVYIRSGLGS